MLTPKQEKYVQELIKGKSQREAYKAAYPNSRKWKDKSVDEKACTLFANVKIKSRYDELQAKAEKKAVWTREQAINDLVRVKELCEQYILNNDNIDSKTANVVLSAIKELNNMCGYNEQTHNIKMDKVIIKNSLVGGD
jgi:phage terminase small subunit